MLPADFHPEARYHYTRLEPLAQEFYLFAVDCLLSRQYRFFFASDEECLSKEEEFRDLPKFVHPDAETIYPYYVFEAITLDCPELYYTGNAYIHFDVYRSLFQFSCEDVDYTQIDFAQEPPFVYPTAVSYTEEEIDALNARLDAILHRFDGIDDPFQLELAVHQFVTGSYDYEYDHELLTGRDQAEIFTVAGPLKRGRGVCAALAALVQFVLQRRGIPVANLVAPAKIEDGEDELVDHAWLAVQIDGEWYHLDVTFDESDTLDPELPQYKHFNVTDEEAREGHVFHSEKFPGIVCTATAANYYHRLGLFYRTAEEIRRAVLDFCRRHEGCGDVRYFYFRYEGLTEDEVGAAIREASLWAIIPSRSLCIPDEGYCALTFCFPAY
jgi:transglutaminase-like putative cysteine protease